MIFAPSNVKDFLFKPGKYFLIPEFQRPYSWTSENIQAFLEDLEYIAADSDDKKHYFGSIVFINDAKDLNAEVIIDGQQRLTTALLMLMAVYHLVLEHPERSSISAEEIRDKYLFNSASYASEENRIRLKTVTLDDKIFNKLYMREELTAEEKQNKLHKAYHEFYDTLADRVNLDAYVNTLSKFDIVTIALNTSDDSPQRVFESINSTGQPLSSGDKIRNFALMLNSSEDQRYVYTNYWQKIERALADPNNDYITDFFRAYLTTHRSSTIPYPSVYPEFKKLFNTKISKDQPRDQLDSFYKDILDNLEYFCMAKFGIDPSGRFAYIEDYFMRMRYLQIEIFFPFAMSVLAAHDENLINEKDVKNCLDLVRIYFSRRIVCNIAVTSVDRMFATLHRDIRNYQSTDSSANYFEVMKFVFLNRSGATKLPRNNELEYAIENNNTYWQKKSNVNYILASPGDESKESDIIRRMNSKSAKESNLSIEHVMPQTLNEKYRWVESLGEDWQRVHEQYLHKLANLTLTGYNSEYSNRSFIEKKTMKNGFNDSPLVINKRLKELDTWTEIELIERQKWWKNTLKNIWPVPETDFKPVEIDTKIYLADGRNLKGTKPRVLHLLGDEVLVTNWASTLDYIVERAFEADESVYKNKIINDEYLSRYIGVDPTRYFSPLQVADTNYYVESGNDTNTKQRIIVSLMSLMNWDKKEIAVELTEKIPV